MSPELRETISMIAQMEAEISENLEAPEAARVLEDMHQVLRVLTPQAARDAYITKILGGESGAIPELFAIARVSQQVTDLQPHAPGRGRRRCDARALFGDLSVFIEVKKQRDRFPFNGPGEEVVPGITAHAGSRPGADPRYAGDLPRNTTYSLPGATIWRETLEEAATQLPEDEPGFIMIACDSFMGLDDDTCAALYGDPIVVARPHPRGWGSIHEDRRFGNGVFQDTRFRHVAGVWFFRLVRSSRQDVPNILLCDWARGALNPNHTGSPLPDELTFSVPNVVGEGEE